MLDTPISPIATLGVLGAKPLFGWELQSECFAKSQDRAAFITCLLTSAGAYAKRNLVDRCGVGDKKREIPTQGSPQIASARFV